KLVAGVQTCALPIFEAGVARRPSELAARAPGRCNQHWRIPHSTLQRARRNGTTGDLAGGLDNLAHAEPCGRAEVVDLQARIALAGRLEREQVRIPQVA